MCGIAGVLSLNHSAQDRLIVESIVRDQIPRGPDSQAIEDIGGPQVTVTFGHDRLAIIDLSAQANQPMWDHSRRHCIIFNGEIYNYIELRNELIKLGHEFRTKSDTEVILECIREWGLAAIDRFNGMFAFALYDAAERKLFLVRDRFGVKPLYYYVEANRLFFASTARELARQLHLQPSLKYLSRGLQSSVYEDDSDLAPYDGLKAVLPSHYLEIATEQHKLSLKTVQYYDLDARVSALRSVTERLSLDDIVELVSSSFMNAVDIRLRSDVPVGIALSGGLDSSMVAAFLSKRHSDVVGFTFGRPDDKSSEGPTVARAAKEIGLEVEYVYPQISELIDAFWSSLGAQDAPFAGGSVVAQYMVYRAARRRNVRVVLGGQGADEIFMGYLKFQFFVLKDLFRQRRFAKLVGSTVGLLSTMSSELRNFPVYWKRRHAYLGRSTKSNGASWPEARVFLGYDSARPLWHRQMKDAVSLSLPTLLRYDDRSSMANSVESRLPFLDYRIVELGLALPEDVKIRQGFGKWIVREIGKGKVPDFIRLNRVGSSRVDLQACKLEYSIVSPK